MYTKEKKGEAAIMRGGSPPLGEGGWTIAASRFGGNPQPRTAEAVCAHPKRYTLHPASGGERGIGRG